MTSTPHDALFKYFFEQPDHAAQLFRHRLPLAFAELIPWDRLVRVSTEFIGDDLAGARTDLLFSAHRPEQAFYLYLLLEHQSTNHPRMPVRLAHYIDCITQRHQHENDGEVPLVIPSSSATRLAAGRRRARITSCFSWTSSASASQRTS